MTWQKQLSDNAVQRHVASKREIDDLRGVVARNLADASVAELSADNRLGIAYEAVLICCKMSVHAAGYRIRIGVPGAHARTLECASLALGPVARDAIDYFDSVRRRRNALSYDVAGTVSEHEARDAARHAADFQQIVVNWLMVKHSHLM